MPRRTRAEKQRIITAIEALDSATSFAVLYHLTSSNYAAVLLCGPTKVVRNILVPREL